MQTSNSKTTGTERIDGTATDELVRQLFATDETAVADYLAVFCRRVRSAEVELMAAVLENGIADLRRCILAQDKKSARRAAAAESWIVDDDSDWVFSFDNCCAALGIDAGYLRKGLLAWRRAQPGPGASSRRLNDKNDFRKAA